MDTPPSVSRHERQSVVAHSATVGEVAATTLATMLATNAPSLTPSAPIAPAPGRTNRRNKSHEMTANPAAHVHSVQICGHRVIRSTPSATIICTSPRSAAPTYMYASAPASPGVTAGCASLRRKYCAVKTAPARMRVSRGEAAVGGASGTPVSGSIDLLGVIGGEEGAEAKVAEASKRSSEARARREASATIALPRPRRRWALRERVT